MKWNLFYQITAASRTPEKWATTHSSPFSLSSVLCPQLNFLNPPQKKKIPGYATAIHVSISVDDLCYVQSTGIDIYFCNGYV